MQAFNEDKYNEDIDNVQACGVDAWRFGDSNLAQKGKFAMRMTESVSSPKKCKQPCKRNFSRAYNKSVFCCNCGAGITFLLKLEPRLTHFAELFSMYLI